MRSPTPLGPRPVQVDPGHVLGTLAVLAQHRTEGLVAPGGLGAAEKQAVVVGVLPLADGSLVAQQAVLGNPAGQGRLIGGIGRPLLGQQQVVQRVVGRVDGQGLVKALEVAVQVHVFVGHTAAVRKAVRVQRVDIQHRHLSLAGVRQPGGIAQRRHLNARAAMPLHTVAGAADDQQLVSTRRTVAGHVHGQSLALCACLRVWVVLHSQARRSGLGQKQCAGLGVGVCKAAVNGVDAGHAAALASHCCTSFTQKLAPRGISASLKS